MKKLGFVAMAAAAAMILSGCAMGGPPGKSNVRTVTFPAYQEGRTDANAPVYDTAPFQASFSLPDGWEIRVPPAKERVSTLPFFTVVDLFDGDTAVGYIGFNTYEPNEGEVLPQEEYYKAVYGQIRLGSMYHWDGYTPVKTTERAESAVATVRYKDPGEIDKHPGAMADVPELEAPGVLCYDKKLRVYIGIQMNPGSITGSDQRALAESVTLSPA